MRYVSAIYDAPMPAGLALKALRAAGFEDRDLAVLPDLPALPPVAGFLARSTEATGDPARALAELGLPQQRHALLREALWRGAIVILVRCPDLSAPAAVRALDAAGPLPDARLARDWRREPGMRYRWSELPAPVLALQSEAATPRVVAPDARPPSAPGLA